MSDRSPNALPAPIARLVKLWPFGIIVILVLTLVLQAGEPSTGISPEAESAAAASAVRALAPDGVRLVAQGQNVWVLVDGEPARLARFDVRTLCGPAFDAAAMARFAAEGWVWMEAGLCAFWGPQPQAPP
ncbi:MAG: hypothetical protein ACFB2Z_04400 [Maricaulaceae bacterium]